MIQARSDALIDEDTLGNVEVPGDHLWGAQTQRSHENFPIGVDRYRWGRPVIRADECALWDWVRTAGVSATELREWLAATAS